MKRKDFAINVFKEFIEENGRIPDCDEFMNIGYCRATYYNVKRDYFEEQAKKAVKEVLRNEAVKGKI